MIKKDKDYNELLVQIHELNRENVLNYAGLRDEIIDKIDNLKINEIKTENHQNDKKWYIILSLLLSVNILISGLILFSNSSDDKLVNTQVKEKIVEEIKNDESKVEKSADAVLFDSKLTELEDNYEDIKPIIRKGTNYICKDDINKYKIPYTIEIKGKLYSDRFEFILQEDSITKECTIKKEEM